MFKHLVRRFLSHAFHGFKIVLFLLAAVGVVFFAMHFAFSFVSTNQFLSKLPVWGQTSVAFGFLMLCMIVVLSAFETWQEHKRDFQ